MWYFVMKQYDPTRTLIMLIADNYDDPPKLYDHRGYHDRSHDFIGVHV